MGKRSQRALAIAFVLLYQLSLVGSASAGFFNWIGSKESTAIMVQPLSTSTTSYSENIWSNNLEIKKSEESPLTNLMGTEPLAKISIDQDEEDKYADPVLVLKGEASYYSWDGCLGCNSKRIMANGKILNDNALTMAIGADKKHLVGREARVTNLSSGKSVVVLITDTGGFYQAKYGYRVADLTIATKQAIGMTGGLAQVQVEVF